MGGGWLKHLLLSGMAPANRYLPQAVFLVVVFADLFHSSQNTLSKICFSFPENPKLQMKWTFEQFCVQIMIIQVVYLNSILYFSENLRSFPFFEKFFLFINLKLDLIETLEASEKT